jgi:hypothetical protein
MKLARRAARSARRSGVGPVDFIGVFGGFDAVPPNDRERRGGAGASFGCEATVAFDSLASGNDRSAVEVVLAVVSSNGAN